MMMIVIIINILYHVIVTFFIYPVQFGRQRRQQQRCQSAESSPLSESDTNVSQVRSIYFLHFLPFGFKFKFIRGNWCASPALNISRMLCLKKKKKKLLHIHLIWIWTLQWNSVLQSAWIAAVLVDFFLISHRHTHFYITLHLQLHIVIVM